MCPVLYLLPAWLGEAVRMNGEKGYEGQPHSKRTYDLYGVPRQKAHEGPRIVPTQKFELPMLSPLCHQYPLG